MYLLHKNNMMFLSNVTYLMSPKRLFQEKIGILRNICHLIFTYPLWEVLRILTQRKSHSLRLLKI